MRSKIEACRIAWPTVSNYEKIKFSTFYKNTFYKNGVFRYIGKAHDYTF